MQTTMEKYSGQRRGFKRVIGSFVNKLEEVKVKKDDLKISKHFIE